MKCCIAYRKMAAVSKTREIGVQAVLFPSPSLKQMENTVQRQREFLAFLFCNFSQLQLSIPSFVSLRFLLAFSLLSPASPLKFMNLENFLWKLSVPLYSQTLPPLHKVRSISVLFKKCACFCLWQCFSWLHRPSNHPLHVFSQCLPTTACYCIPLCLLFLASCCFSFLFFWCPYYLKIVQPSKKIWVVCFTFDS